MPMKMGILCKPYRSIHSGFLDSRICGNDGGMFFLRKCLRRLGTCKKIKSQFLREKTGRVSLLSQIRKSLSASVRALIFH